MGYLNLSTVFGLSFWMSSGPGPRRGQGTGAVHGNLLGCVEARCAGFARKSANEEVPGVRRRCLLPSLYAGSRRLRPERTYRDEAGHVAHRDGRSAHTVAGT